MAAPRRLQKELTDLQTINLRSFRDVEVDEDNLLTWHGLVVPDNPPYNKGAFKIEINFPVDYPFRPPKLFFHTKIYHPNIDDNGYICLPIITPDNWKPATKMEQVINALVALVNDPEPENAIRPEIAKEMVKDKRKFIITAEEFTRKYSEKRPVD